jgi:hypothetical protein
LDEDEDELERGLGDSEVDVDVAEFGGLGAEESVGLPGGETSRRSPDCCKARTRVPGDNARNLSGSGMRNWEASRVETPKRFQALIVVMATTRRASSVSSNSFAALA